MLGVSIGDNTVIGAGSVPRLQDHIWQGSVPHPVDDHNNSSPDCDEKGGMLNLLLHNSNLKKYSTYSANLFNENGKKSGICEMSILLGVFLPLPSSLALPLLAREIFGTYLVHPEE